MIDLIQRHQAEILADWEGAMRQLPVARDLPHSVLLDRFPQLLARIVSAVKDLTEGRATPTPAEDTPKLHALDRLDIGFDLRHVVTEYAVLRTCILRVLGEHTTLVEPDSIRLVNQAIDHAISDSVAHFTQARDRTLNAVDRVSAAALECRELYEFLHELLRVLVEAAHAVDTAAILLREGDELRVRAAVGLEEEIATQVSIRMGEGFAGSVAQQGRPLLLASGSADPLVKSAILRGKQVHALYGVPLSDGNEVLGVAHIGSFTAHDFSEQDKHLFAAVAARATAGIFQHMLRDQLMRAVSTRDHVLAVVSHDLKNPLSVIQMCAALLLLQIPPGDEGERARAGVERIIRSTQRMATLIKDLLDVASIEAGRLAMDMQEEDVDSILGEALDVNLPLATEKCISLQRDGGPTTALLRCDRARILQALGNLIGNSVKFTLEGGSIAVGVQVENQGVVFWVSDTGTGIAESDIPHLFEPYWQSTTTRGQKMGVGLGLAIAKGIVQAHGGSLWVESTAGKGAKFFFALPLEERKTPV